MIELVADARRRYLGEEEDGEGYQCEKPCDRVRGSGEVLFYNRFIR